MHARVVVITAGMLLFLCLTACSATLNAEAGFGLGMLTEEDAAASIERTQVRATGLDGSMARWSC